MARLIDYDKLHNDMFEHIFVRHIECSRYKPILWQLYNRILGLIEVQEMRVDWDERKKLLQPKKSNLDWSVFNEAVEAVMYKMPSSETDVDAVFQDWLSDYMYEYDITPDELLMENRTEDNTDKEDEKNES